MKIIRDKFKDLWEEKYRPQCVDDIVLPEDIRSQFKEWVEKGSVPNLMFVSSIPGCSVEGNNVDIIFDGKTKEEWIEKYPLLKSDFIWYNISEKVDDKYIINEVVIEKINNNWKKYKNDIIEIIAFDKSYNSKYLKLSYWLNFNDIEYSIKKVLFLRNHKDLFENNSYLNMSKKELLLKRSELLNKEL